jgi:hypothetical protein
VIALRYGQDDTQGSFPDRPVVWYARVLPATQRRFRLRLFLRTAAMLPDKLGDAYTGPIHNSLFLPEKVATSDGHVTRPFARAMPS